MWDENEDPVRRTKRQLRCYYECVSRDPGETFEDLVENGELCEDCGACLDHCGCDEFDDDDELGLPRY